MVWGVILPRVAEYRNPGLMDAAPSGHFNVSSISKPIAIPMAIPMPMPMPIPRRTLGTAVALIS